MISLGSAQLRVSTHEEEQDSLTVVELRTEATEGRPGLEDAGGPSNVHCLTSVIRCGKDLPVSSAWWSHGRMLQERSTTLRNIWQSAHSEQDRLPASEFRKAGRLRLCSAGRGAGCDDHEARGHSGGCLEREEERTTHGRIGRAHSHTHVNLSGSMRRCFASLRAKGRKFGAVLPRPPKSFAGAQLHWQPRCAAEQGRIVLTRRSWRIPGLACGRIPVCNSARSLVPRCGDLNCECILILHNLRGFHKTR